jgi:hypothetical protein
VLRVVHRVPISDLRGTRRELQICVGDATHASKDEFVDLLALSCFRDDYVPTPGTLVRALGERGIDVGHLALEKAGDWRPHWQTWISHPLAAQSGFGRLVCFEYQSLPYRSSARTSAVDPAAVVGNVFRAVTEFILGHEREEISLFRMPLLSTGDQAADPSAMLSAIVREAYAHLRACLPVGTVQIVLYDKSPLIHRLLVECGRLIEQTLSEWLHSRVHPDPAFDYFISYRRSDRALVDRIISGLRDRLPDARLFRDEQTLKHGVCWKPELVCGIHNSRRALCVITDSYADSVECIDEFHVALRCSQIREDFLRPVIRLATRSVESLPLSIRRVNLISAACPPRSFTEVIDDIVCAEHRGP